METQGAPPPISKPAKGRWKRLPTWSKWTLGLIVGLVLLVTGVAIGASEENSLKVQISDLESELAVANGAVSRLNGTRVRVISEARDRADDIVGDAKEEADKLASVEENIEAAEGRLVGIEASIGGAKKEAAKSAIADGIWQAETDYVPGTYRIEGKDGCYWAKLNSAETSDIADNNNGLGQQVVAIDSPYFQTEGCGTWERIGD
jgi:hypothetical protein